MLLIIWKFNYKPSFSCLHLASPVRSVSGRPVPRHCWLGAGSPGWWMDRWAGCTAPVGLSEWWVQRSSIQAQRHPQKQTPAGLAGLWYRGRPAFSSSHIYIYRQGDRGRGATATSSHKGDRWKYRKAEERGESTEWDILTVLTFFMLTVVFWLFPSRLPSFRTICWTSC